MKKRIFVKFTALILSVLTLSSCSVVPYLPQGKDTKINSYYGSLTAKDEWLYNGIIHKNLEQVNEALKAGASVNEVHVKGRIETFPAYIAGTDGDSATVQLLMDKGADVNHSGLGGQTFLMGEACITDINLCDYLIKHGAKIDKTDVLGHTALDYVIDNDDEENYNIQTVNFLLSKGAKISQKTVKLTLKNNLVNGYGCKYLLAHSVLLKFLKINGKSGLDPILESAIIGDSPKECRLIRQGKLKKEYKNLIMFYTAAFGTVDTMKLLRQKGLNIHLKDEDYDTLLMIASKYGNLAMVKYLIGAGLDIKAKNGNGNAMTLAENNNHADVTEYFLNSVHGVSFSDFKIPDVTKYSDVLNMPAQNNNKKLIDFVLNKGFVLDKDSLSNAVRATQDPIRTTYLTGELSDVDKQLSTLQYLLDIGKKGGVSCDLTQYLCYMPDLKVAKFLVEHGADVNGEPDRRTPLSTAIDYNNLALVKYLIAKGANVDAPTLLYKNGLMDETLMNSAVMLGRFDIIKAMVNSGANLELENSRKETPLCVAAKYGSSDIVQYLLQKGCKINSRDQNGDTPLMFAVKNGWIQNVKLLLKFGADKNSKDKRGKTAMDIAKGDNDKVMIALLQK